MSQAAAQILNDLTSEEASYSSLEQAHSFQVTPRSNRIFWLAAFGCYLFVLQTQFPFILQFPTELNWRIAALYLGLYAPLVWIVHNILVAYRTRFPAIRLNSCYLYAPLKIGSSKYVRVPYASMQGVDLRGRGKNKFVVIETSSKLLHLARSGFGSHGAWQAFISLLLSHIGALDDGEQRLANFAMRRTYVQHIFGRIPYASVALVLACVAVYLVQVVFGLFDEVSLAVAGANSSVMLANGQLYRVVTGGFLHAGVLHLVLNMCGLLALGYLVEGVLGQGRLLVIYCASIICGSLLTSVSGTLLSVGASSGVFGLLGAYAVLCMHYATVLPSGYAMRRCWWVYALLINIALPILLPRVDVWAHVGGFLMGAALCWLFVRGRDVAELVQPETRAWKIVGLVPSVIIVVSGALAVAAALSPESRAATRYAVVEAYTVSEDVSAWGLNDLAWGIAIDRAARRVDLILAESAVRRSLALKDDVNTKDTLATLRFRLGAVEEAIEIEAGLFSEDNPDYLNSFFAEQFVRFARAAQLRVNHAAQSELYLLAELSTGEQALVRTRGGKGSERMRSLVLEDRSEPVKVMHLTLVWQRDQKDLSKEHSDSGSQREVWLLSRETDDYPGVIS